MKFGDYYYMAYVDPLPFMKLAEIDPATFAVRRNVDVGLASFPDPHLKPTLCITEEGWIYVFSGYTEWPLRCWISTVSSLSFSEHPIGVVQHVSYPAAFPLSDNRVMLLVRGGSSLKIIIGSRNQSVWSVRDTIWSYSGGVQMSCYYFSAIYRGGVLFVGAVGKRSSAMFERRENVYYSTSSDLGVSWSSGLIPELVYAGYVSRVSLQIDDVGSPLMLMSYLWENTETYYKLLYKTGGTWIAADLPLGFGEWAALGLGYECVRKIGNIVHVFVCVSSSGYIEGQRGDVYHYYASFPFVAWQRNRVTESGVWMREVAAFVEDGGRILGFANENEVAQYVISVASSPSEKRGCGGRGLLLMR